MSCSPCVLVRQIIFNVLLVLDHVLNTILLGDPSETVSQRLYRAREHGSWFALKMCSFLTLFNKPDHCAWSVDPSVPSIGRELWNWNTNRIEKPTNQVTEIEINR